MWGEIRSLNEQVYSMVSQGHLERWEARGMTNIQRKGWLDQMTAEAKRQQEAMEKARGDAKPAAKRPRGGR
jgi:hypothetical protein